MAFYYSKGVNILKLVCGVQGVGKTVFSKKMSIEKSINYYVASELIRKKTSVQKMPVYKSIQDISKNQVILLNALSEIEDKQYILDGHLCLLNQREEIERIGYSVFESMKIDSIYIVVDNPIEIQRRIKNRDNQVIDAGFITLFQQEEIKYAKLLSEKLKVPLKFIYHNNEIFDYSFLETSNIVLPIKPIYANKILQGEKKYEFRKKICKKDIGKIYIYATSPVKMIVGEAKVIGKHNMKKEQLWIRTKYQAGIDKEFYDCYFAKQEYACAYEIGDVKQYENPITLKSVGIDYVPQSYIYVGELNTKRTR